MLTEQGMVEAEYTAARVSEGIYLVGAAVGEVRFFDWLSSCVVEGEDVSVNNVSDELGVLSTPCRTSLLAEPVSDPKSERPRS